MRKYYKAVKRDISGYGKPNLISLMVDKNSPLCKIYRNGPDLQRVDSSLVFDDLENLERWLDYHGRYYGDLGHNLEYQWQKDWFKFLLKNTEVWSCEGELIARPRLVFSQIVTYSRQYDSFVNQPHLADALLKNRDLEALNIDILRCTEAPTGTCLVEDMKLVAKIGNYEYGKSLITRGIK